MAGRALMRSKYRNIMDSDEQAWGVFPLVKEEIDQATRFPFAKLERAVLE
jgi:hypothetical protein